MSSPWASGQSFPRRAFTTGVPWVSRVWLLVGFVTVAWTASGTAADGVWLTVISVAGWWAVGQFVLYDSFTDGWTAGEQAGFAEFNAVLEARLEEARVAQGFAGRSINMPKLLDLCEQHGVPMAELADLIYGEEGKR